LIWCALDDVWARVYNIFVLAGEATVVSGVLWRETAILLEVDRAGGICTNMVSDLISFPLPTLSLGENERTREVLLAARNSTVLGQDNKEQELTSRKKKCSIA
jgi:hypothetical protein